MGNYKKFQVDKRRKISKSRKGGNKIYLCMPSSLGSLRWAIPASTVIKTANTIDKLYYGVGWGTITVSDIKNYIDLCNEDDRWKMCKGYPFEQCKMVDACKLGQWLGERRNPTDVVSGIDLLLIQLRDKRVGLRYGASS